MTFQRLSTVAAAALTAGTLMTGAASASVTIGGSPAGGIGIGSVDPDNSFVAPLVAAGMTTFVTHGTISLAWAAKLIFTEVAAESGYSNDFTVTGVGTMTETSSGSISATPFLTASLGETLSKIFTAGAIAAGDLVFDGPGAAATIGDLDFGIFYNPADTSVFFLAYDDQDGLPTSDDDNHDDYIVRVNVASVPVPAAGLLLLTAVGGIAALRRRKTA
jgi:hypothetical protein